tara:strand:- start:92 stop:373 length:282 start_codon:yes stop_codon:yes gene_type:complete
MKQEQTGTYCELCLKNVAQVEAYCGIFICQNCVGRSMHNKDIELKVAKRNQLITAFTRHNAAKVLFNTLDKAIISVKNTIKKLEKMEKHNAKR